MRRLVAASLVQALLWPVGANAQPALAPADGGAGVARDANEGAENEQRLAQDKETVTQQPTRKESRGPSVTQLPEIVVEAERPLTAASSDVIRARDFALRPHSTTQEILNNVPGLLVVQHAGGGKAVQYFLRGFDIDHGTDFALFTDGIPVNMVTHAHGQGYADINYIIPETVDDLQLFKGPYFVELGDFATAGALKFTTKDEFRENFALAEGGSFDTQRYVLGGSVPLTWAKTLLAAEAYFTNGPFDNPEEYSRYNVFGKLTISPFVDQRLSFLGSVYSGDWDGSGQIPDRIVGNGPGEIDRFASLDNSEGGKSDRENLSAQWNYKPSAQEEWSAQLWGSRYHLRLFSDFTFFKDSGLRFYRPTPSSAFVDRCAGLDVCLPLPDPSIPLDAFIPGDGIQQDDTRLLFGGYVSYNRFYSVADVPWLGDLPMQTEFGLQTRRDDIDVALYRQIRRNNFFAVNKVGVEEQSLSGYWGQQIFFTDWARLEGGLRGDVFFFNVRNRLPQQAVDPNFSCLPNADGVCPSSGVPTNASGAVLIQGNDVQGLPSPKVNLVLGPWYETDVYANFGYGFHSNDARAVILSGQDGLVPALGYELGSRTRQFDRLDVAAALWVLDLDSELVFSGDGGGLDADPEREFPDGEPVAGNFIAGPSSRRWGIDFETRYQFTDWLFADYDLSFADPRFKNGGAIPLAPTLLMNGGLTADFASWSNLLNGFAGALRFRFLDNRPANEERTFTAEGFTLLDLLLRYRWRNVEASLSLLNITDAAWRQSQFVEATCVNQIPGLDFGQPANNDQPCLAGGNRPNQMVNGATGVFADGIESITFTPGSPFAVRGGIQIFF